jgi:hypothetical protein
MAKLNDLKIPIYMGINDQPRSPTQALAGNGSHVVKTINDIIDALNPPTEIWSNYKSFYLDLTSGSDSNNGDTSSTPKKTWGALIDRIQTKQLSFVTYVYVKGSFSGTLDFSNVWGNSTQAWVTGLSQLRIQRWSGSDPKWQYQGSGELLRMNPLSPIEVRFLDGDFVATDGAITVLRNEGFVNFNVGCTFDTGTSNYDSILHFESCRLIRILDYTGITNMKNSGGNIWVAIIANNGTQLWFDGLIFQNVDYALAVYANSVAANFTYICDFGGATTNFDVYENSRLYTRQPEETLPSLVYVGLGGEINRSHTQTFFFASLSPSTIAPLYRARTQERLQYVRVDGNLSGATFQVQIDGLPVGNPLDELAREFYFDRSFSTTLDEGSEIGLVITGNPTNVSLRLELMEF